MTMATAPRGAHSSISRSRACSQNPCTTRSIESQAVRPSASSRPSTVRGVTNARPRPSRGTSRRDRLPGQERLEALLDALDALGRAVRVRRARDAEEVAPPRAVRVVAAVGVADDEPGEPHLRLVEPRDEARVVDGAADRDHGRAAAAERVEPALLDQLAELLRRGHALEEFREGHGEPRHVLDREQHGVGLAVDDAAGLDEHVPHRARQREHAADAVEDRPAQRRDLHHGLLVVHHPAVAGAAEQLHLAEPDEQRREQDEHERRRDRWLRPRCTVRSVRRARPTGTVRGSSVTGRTGVLIGRPPRPRAAVRRARRSAARGGGGGAGLASASSAGCVPSSVGAAASGDGGGGGGGAGSAGVAVGERGGLLAHRGPPLEQPPRGLRGLEVGAREALLALGADAILVQGPQAIAEVRDVEVQADAHDRCREHRSPHERRQERPHRSPPSATRPVLPDPCCPCATAATPPTPSPPPPPAPAPTRPAGSPRAPPPSAGSPSSSPPARVPSPARRGTPPSPRVPRPSGTRSPRAARRARSAPNAPSSPRARCPRLVVHRHAQRLERARRGVDARGVARDHALDRQRPGRARSARGAPATSARATARARRSPPSSKITRASSRSSVAVHEVGGGRASDDASNRMSARSSSARKENPRSAHVELRRRDAEVEQHRVGPPLPRLLEDLGEVRVRGVEQAHPGAEPREPRLRGLQRDEVAIEAEEPARRPRGEHRLRVAAEPHRPVDDERPFTVLRPEVPKHLVRRGPADGEEKDRRTRPTPSPTPSRGASPRRPASRSPDPRPRESRCPAATSQRSGSQSSR